MLDPKRTLNSELALQQLRALLSQSSAEDEFRLPPERQLASSFGVGRRALRHALDILEKEGAIWRRQGQGTFSGQRNPAALHGSDYTARAGSTDTALQQINPLTGFRYDLADFTNPLEVMDVRIEIEPALARMAAARATSTLVQHLEGLAAKAEQSTDVATWERWDAAFHAKIAEASGNHLFIAIMHMIDNIRQNEAWRDFRTRVRSSGRTALSVSQHHAILDAIRRFHPLEAEAAMRAHLTSLRDAVLEEIGGVSRASEDKHSID